MTAPPADASAVSAGGTTAWRESLAPETAYGIDETVHWWIPNSNHPGRAAYEVYAYLRGPDLVPLETQLNLMISSVQLQ